MAERPKIPEPIKRVVRQRCGFGCIICGMPVYHYDHMIEYHIVERHDEDNITLLCPKHHEDKSRKKMSLDQVVEFDKNPVNRTRGLTKESDELLFDGKCVKVRIAGSLFTSKLSEPDGRFDLIVINDRPLRSFYVEDGRLLLDIEIHDRKGKVVLFVHKSELRHTTGKWDVEYVGKMLKIKEQARDAILELVIWPPNGIELALHERQVWVEL